MSKIKSLFAIAIFAVGTSLLHAQTIDELASMQRVKINDELLKAKGLPDSQQAAQLAAVAAQAASRPAMLPSPPRLPSMAVHALITVGSGITVAELTDGRNLILAIPGHRYGDFKIASVSPTGVSILPAACKGKCTGARLVPLGGVF
jgi:hypothetical protein